MALRGGQILHIGNGVTLIDRLQTAGVNSLNVSSEQIYELGNYQSIGTIRDVPDLTFNMESFDTSCEVEALLTHKDLATTSSFDLTTVRSIDITSPFKAGKDSPNLYDAVTGAAVPYLMPESISYRFGLKDNARQTVSLRGDSLFYTPGAPLVQTAMGSGTAGQTIVTANPAGIFNDSTGPRRVLAVVAGGSRLTPGVDYTVTGGTAGQAFAAATVTIAKPVAVTDEIRVTYFTDAVQSFPQTVHALPTVIPGAVKGKDIHVYVGGYDPLDIPGSQVNRLTGVQSVNIDWRATIDKTEEFGNYYATDIGFDVPTASGSIEFIPRDPQDLMDKIRRAQGITNVNEALGANRYVPAEMDVVITNGADGSTLKRIHLDAATFDLPAMTSNANQKSSVTLNLNDDFGRVVVFKD